MSSDYSNLQTIQKVEIFKSVLEATDGKDLKNILWLQSRTAEVWLERRTEFTRSLALMSMVGYILGLGDRHCSNLMLDRQSGKIIHIDFGDCFEVAMHRDKFPERIPFRLTRMLTTAMGVSGIEGNFRSTCESVMRVLRENKESLMAVLEAFVYDPLISWRLFTPKDKEAAQKAAAGSNAGNNSTDPVKLKAPMQSKPLVLEDEDMLNALTTKDKIGKSLEDEGESQMEATNDKAVQITNRINSKLTGKDFAPRELDVKEQVDMLIKQATDVENLCQCYIGWSPYW